MRPLSSKTESPKSKPLVPGAPARGFSRAPQTASFVRRRIHDRRTRPTNSGKRGSHRRFVKQMILLASVKFIARWNRRLSVLSMPQSLAKSASKTSRGFFSDVARKRCAARRPAAVGFGRQVPQGQRNSPPCGVLPFGNSATDPSQAACRTKSASSVRRWPVVPTARHTFPRFPRIPCRAPHPTETVPPSAALPKISSPTAHPTPSCARNPLPPTRPEGVFRILRTPLEGMRVPP